MAKSNSSNSGGIGFWVALFLLFLNLRLAGVIIGFTSIWIPLAVVAVLLMLIALCGGFNR